MPCFAAALAIAILLSGSANHWASTRVVSNWADVPSYFIQARIFAAGHLAVPSPEPREFFSSPYLFNQGLTFSKYPPGWPALLALGMLARTPWIVNPLLTVLGLAVVFRLGRRLYGLETAAMATALMAVSVHVVYHATTYFSEPASTLFAALGALTVLKALRSESNQDWLLAGSCWGVLFLIRPYTAVALGLPVAIYGVSILCRRPRIGPVVVALIPFAGLIALHLLYNRLSTGSALTFPFNLYNPQDRLGFGLRALDIDVPPTHYGWSIAVRKLLRATVMANAVFIPLGFIFAGISLAGRRRGRDWLLLACFLSVVLFHFFYFAQQERYWLPAFFAIALLAAKGIRQVGVAIESRFPGYPAQRTSRTLFALVAVASLVQTTDKLWREELPLRRRLADPFDRVAEAKLNQAVVFLVSAPAPNVGHYIQTAPEVNAPVLFVRDRGTHNDDLTRRYPERGAYRYEYSRAVGRGRLYPIPHVPTTHD